MRSPPTRRRPAPESCGRPGRTPSAPPYRTARLAVAAASGRATIGSVRWSTRGWSGGPVRHPDHDRAHVHGKVEHDRLRRRRERPAGQGELIAADAHHQPARCAGAARPDSVLAGRHGGDLIERPVVRPAPPGVVEGAGSIGASGQRPAPPRGGARAGPRRRPALGPSRRSSSNCPGVSCSPRTPAIVHSRVTAHIPAMAPAPAVAVARAPRPRSQRVPSQRRSAIHAAAIAAAQIATSR